jgi:uncharacterized membrane protein YccC
MAESSDAAGGGETGVRWSAKGQWGQYTRQTLRLLAACALSYLLARLFGLREDYWALITAIVVTQPALGDTLAASRNRVVGTLIGAAAGFAVLEAAQHGLPQFALFWCALVPLALLTAIRQSLRLSGVTLVVVVLIPSQAAPFVRPLDRVFGILLGTLASIAVAAAIRTRPAATALPIAGTEVPAPRNR